jgi:hypothetical protein
MTLQALPSRICIPNIPIVSPSYTGLIINDDTDEIAILICIPISGTALKEVIFSTGTITTGENAVPVRIETVGANGLPSGSLYVANANGTVNIADGDDSTLKSVAINGGTGVACTAGNWVYIRM